MPIIKSAIKRMKQTAVRRERNVATKKQVKSAVKAFLEKPTADGYKAAQSEIDTAVKKNILNKRTAARRKSQLSRVAKEAGVKFEKTVKKAAAKPATTKKPAVKATVKTATKAPAKKPAAKATAKKPVAAKKSATKTAK